MTTKRKPPKSSKPAPVSIRINGRAVTHAEGAKLAAEWLGCTQTTGPQAGQGSVLQMVEAIGAGCVAQFGVDDLIDLPALSNVIDDLADKYSHLYSGEVSEKYNHLHYVGTVLHVTAAALRNAARLRESSEK